MLPLQLFQRNLEQVISATAFCLLFPLVLLFPEHASASDETDARPNIVIIVADDLGYGELGCQGNPQIPTPHIDSLADDGVRFTNGYVTAAFCSASRAGLLTGRYQARFGYEFNPIGAQNEDPDAGLPTGQKTLANLLHDVGYTTALVGKWHLGGTSRYNPMRRGFDEFFGFLHEGHFFVPPPYDGVSTMLRRRAIPGRKQGRWHSADGRTVLTTHMGHDEPDYDADNPIYRGGQPVVETEYLTDAFSREAAGFIRRNADRPFFLYLAYNAVHSPLQGLDDYMKKFEHIEDVHRRIFAAMLSNLDDGVGVVLNELKARNLQDNTLVFFISDNGGPTKELTSSNLPLRGGKGTLYEGGLRVPFLVRYPGVIPQGVTYNQPVISLDMYATAASVADARLPTNVQLDGVNLIPYLTGKNAGKPHQTLYWRTGDKAALRHEDWKLVRNPVRGSGREWQLYNLANDLSETNDLADEKPDLRDHLINRWESLDQQMMDPVWTPWSSRDR
ncbi:MAG: N-acetylgalactosamine-6-sulfatase [Fuerstiella sp.]